MTAVLANSDFIQGVDTLFIADKAIRISRVYYEPEAYKPTLFAQFAIQKPAVSNNWLPQRQAQFLAGRLAVKENTAHLPCFGVPVSIGAHREPIWPVNYIGSISHAQNSAIAAVKESGTPQSALGIDIQTLIDKNTQARIATTIFSGSELSLIQREKGLPESVLFTLAFSAKESFFKAAFYTVKRYFDFDAICLIAVDTTRQSLTFEVVTDLAEALPKGFQFEVCFMETSLFKPELISCCLLSC